MNMPPPMETFDRRIIPVLKICTSTMDKGVFHPAEAGFGPTLMSIS
jgi:hypothetical protein